MLSARTRSRKRAASWAVGSSRLTCRVRRWPSRSRYSSNPSARSARSSSRWGAGASRMPASACASAAETSCASRPPGRIGASTPAGYMPSGPRHGAASTGQTSVVLSCCVGRSARCTTAVSTESSVSVPFTTEIWTGKMPLRPRQGASSPSTVPDTPAMPPAATAPPSRTGQSSARHPRQLSRRSRSSVCHSTLRPRLATSSNTSTTRRRSDRAALPLFSTSTRNCRSSGARASLPAVPCPSMPVR